MESGTRETAKEAFIILAKSQGLLPDDFDTSKARVVAVDYMDKSLDCRIHFDIVGREINRLLAAFVCGLGDYDDDATEEIIGHPPEWTDIAQYKRNAFALLSGAVLMAAMSDTGMTVEVAMRGVICDMTKIMDGISELSTAWISSVGGKYDISELSYDDLQVCFDGLFSEWEKHRVEYIETVSEGTWKTINAVVSEKDAGLVNRCGVLLMNLLVLMNTTGIEVDIGMAIAVNEDGDVNFLPPLSDLDFLTDRDKEYLSNLFEKD